MQFYKYNPTTELQDNDLMVTAEAIAGREVKKITAKDLSQTLMRKAFTHAQNSLTIADDDTILFVKTDPADQSQTIQTILASDFAEQMADKTVWEAMETALDGTEEILLLDQNGTRQKLPLSVLADYLGGKGLKGVVELTQAEYDALGEEKNSDGIMYFVTDGTGQGGSGGSGVGSNQFPFTWEGNMEQRMNTFSYLPVLVNALDDNGGTTTDPPEEVDPGEEELPEVVVFSDAVEAPDVGMDSNPYLIGMPPNIFFYSLYDAANVPPSVRRSIYRGKCLGNTYTEDQNTQVQLGQFHDMFLGDYWEDENYVRWTIVDFDYWMGCRKDDSGDIIRKHHLTIMPLGNVYEFQSTWGASTANGYVNASVRTFIANTVVPKAEAVFGEMSSLSKSEYLVGASGSQWVTDADYELPSQEMIFGSRGTKVAGYDTNPFQSTAGQLAIFTFHAPFQFMEEVEGAFNMWLQDILAEANNIVLVINSLRFTVNAYPTSMFYALPVFGVI